jgi:drug/metabolite transporter (DMT)-like permease
LKNIIKSTSSSPAINVLMFSIFWALQIFFAKMGFNAGALVLPFQLLITIIAFVVLVVLILPKVKDQFSDLYKNQKPLFWKLYLANGIQAGLGTSLAMVGIALTDAVNAGFLVKFTTVTTIFFAWIMLKEKLTALKIVTVILMLFGVYLLTTEGQAIIPRPGDIILIAACVCWSSGSVLVRKFLKDQPLNPDVVTMQKPMASLPILLILIGFALAYTSLAGIQDNFLSCCTVNSMDLIYGLLTGISLAMAWIFVYRTLKVATASYLTLMSMLTPVIVSILAILFLGETLVWVQVIGAGLILISGIVIYFSDMAYA